MSTVRTFRLINGDVLIAETDDNKPEDSTSIYVTNPAIIFLKNTSDGKTDGVMAPYMPFAEDGRVSVFKHALASECTPADKLVQEYKRLFGLGLEILTKEQVAATLQASKAASSIIQ